MNMAHSGQKELVSKDKEHVKTTNQRTESEKVFL
jgi:hypothetical protein